MVEPRPLGQQKVPQQLLGYDRSVLSDFQHLIVIEAR
jgi:hypothetical protein